MTVAHHSDGHECHPQAVDERDCNRFTEMEGYDYYAGIPPRDREDALFWVPHQQRLGELVEFDRLTSTIDDIITGCGYREKDREWLTDAHRAFTRHFLRCYEGPTVDKVPLLGNQ